MRRWWRENSLTITIAAFFVVFLLGQSLAGHHEYNDERAEHGNPPIGYVDYLRSGHFLGAVFENWESEFLQMGLYVVLTIHLRQKGSSESKKLDEPEPVDEDPRLHRDDPDAPRPVRKGGWQLRFYEHSLSLAVIALFVITLALHAEASWRHHNEELAEQSRPPSRFCEFVVSSRFWFESFQNWQSEFFAVGVVGYLTIYLRERGSPESKPVAAPHRHTGSS
jgi:hypothetical protein